MGLHYETTIQTLTPEISTTEGTTQNARKRTSEVTLRFMETTGAECNGQVIPFRTFGPKSLTSQHRFSPVIIISGSSVGSAGKTP